MSHFQHKLILLEQNYYKVKQKLYCQELISINGGIILKQDKIWSHISYIHRSCSYCQEVYRQYYAVIEHQQGITQLCLKCTYDILINKHLQCKYSTKNDYQINNKLLLFDSNNSEIMRQSMNIPFSQPLRRNHQIQQDGMLNTFNSQLQTSPNAKQQHLTHKSYSIQQLQHYQLQKDPILFKLTNQFNLNEIHKQLMINKITIITSQNVQYINMPNPYKIKPQQILSQMNYLTYFYKNILMKALIKTYNYEDKINKNQIRYLYQYWIKYVKQYLQGKKIKLKQFMNRPGQESKKLLQGDKQLSELNINSHQYYRGLQKNTHPWNQLVSNLKNKKFHFEDLPVITFIEDLISINQQQKEERND